jgi:hypothetical protein
VNEIELDLDGPAAPPRANGEMVFEHPWQSRIFATTVALCDSGTIDYDEFRRHLIAQPGTLTLTRSFPGDKLAS